MSKMHQNTFGGRALPGPAGGALALFQTSGRNQGLPTSKLPQRVLAEPGHQTYFGAV